MQTEEALINEWGQLRNSLTSDKLWDLFRGIGMSLYGMSRAGKFSENGEKFAEVDVILNNETEDIAMEVLPTFRPEEVEVHMDRLDLLRKRASSYKKTGRILYGAIAALRFEAGAEVYAEKCGLFALKCDGTGVTILNEDGFKPKLW